MNERAMVDSPDALTEVTSAIGRAALVAIDTEFVRERTFYPELCLIQVAAGDLVACVDCLADLDMTSFFAALLRPDCTWVLHSARQDLEVIWNRTQQLPARLIDTQIAGALIGNGSASSPTVKESVARRSTRSFRGSPACPLTQTQRISCARLSSYSLRHSSWFLIGCPALVRHPRANQPSIHDVIPWRKY